MSGVCSSDKGRGGSMCVGGGGGSVRRKVTGSLPETVTQGCWGVCLPDGPGPLQLS